MGERWDGYPVDAWAKALAAHGLLIPLARLFAFNEIGSEESKPAIAHPQAASVVKYLIERYGFKKFMLAYEELKGSRDESVGKDNLEKFVKRFGSPIDEVERAWLEGLKSRAIEPIPEARILAIKSKYP